MELMLPELSKPVLPLIPVVRTFEVCLQHVAYHPQKGYSSHCRLILFFYVSGQWFGLLCKVLLMIVETTRSIYCPY